jgi:hypothetical protein
MSKKVVRLSEEKLVEMMEKIVAEAVAEKKKEWIAEQAEKEETILESRIKELEAKIQTLTESK